MSVEHASSIHYAIPNISIPAGHRFTEGVDDLVFDKDNKRLYLAADGFVDVYQEESPDNYKLVTKVPTGPAGRTAKLVPELKRYFVAVPQHETTPSEVLVYEVQ